MDIITYNEETQIFEYSGIRPEFIQSTGGFQPGSSVSVFGVDVCHSISFFTIVRGVVNALNYFQHYITDEKKRQNSVQYIAGMIVSVLTEKVDEEAAPSLFDWCCIKARQNEHKYLERYADLLSAIKEAETSPLLSYDDEDKHSVCVKTYIAAKASEIVRLLNSEKSNLRVGCSRWNRTVQSAYDPISVLEVEDGLFLDNEQDQIRITNIMRYTLGGCDRDNGTLIPGAVDALHFYTFTTPEGKKKIYSSSLPYIEWVSAKNAQPCDCAIWYHDYIVDKDVAISTYTE